MRKFVAKHATQVTGTLSCFDRLLFKGHLPLGYPHAMEQFLTQRRVLMKDLKAFVLQQAARLKTQAAAAAEHAGRPYEYLASLVRKDQRARAIAARDGVTEGLICVFSTVEPCRTFRLAYGHGRPAIRPVWRKCLFLYFYFLDREFGFCHVRVPTWFPFTVQVYVNGHEWLARQMDKRGLRYRRLENAFLWLEDPGRVQRLADRFAPLPWPAILDRFARQVNPLLRDELAGYRYYWATHQAEYSTDVLFTSRTALRALYARLLRHATLCLRAEDVLTFLGRKLHGRFAGELLNDCRPLARRPREALDEGELEHDVRQARLRAAGRDGHLRAVRVQRPSPGATDAGVAPLAEGRRVSAALCCRVGGSQPALPRCPRGGRRPGARAPCPRARRAAGAGSPRAVVPRVQPGGRR